MDKLLGHQGRKPRGLPCTWGHRLPHTGFPAQASIACQLGTTGNTDSSQKLNTGKGLVLPEKEIKKKTWTFQTIEPFLSVYLGLNTEGESYSEVIRFKRSLARAPPLRALKTHAVVVGFSTTGIPHFGHFLPK